LIKENHNSKQPKLHECFKLGDVR